MDIVLPPRDRNENDRTVLPANEATIQVAMVTKIQRWRFVLVTVMVPTTGRRLAAAIVALSILLMLCLERITSATMLLVSSIRVMFLWRSLFSKQNYCDSSVFGFLVLTLVASTDSLLHLLHPQIPCSKLCFVGVCVRERVCEL